MKAVLWNRNYFLRFRFRFQLLKSYGSGSGSDFWKVTVPVPVPAPYLDHKTKFFKKFFRNFIAFFLLKLFYKEKVYKFQQIYCKIWMKRMLNEDNQIHNFISSSGSGTVINYGSGGSDFFPSYGSGSTSQKVTVPTVPVPQHWMKGDEVVKKIFVLHTCSCEIGWNWSTETETGITGI